MSIYDKERETLIAELREWKVHLVVTWFNIVFKENIFNFNPDDHDTVFIFFLFSTKTNVYKKYSNNRASHMVMKCSRK